MKRPTKINFILQFSIIFLFLVITFFNVDINISLGADDCGTAAGTAGFECMDITGQGDISTLNCVTGHCPGGVNNVCCKPAAASNEVSTQPTDSNKSVGTVSLTDPLGLPKDQPIPTLLGKIINSVLGIIGSLALVMFIYGGATWMLSVGNQEQVTKGKNILIWATAGIVVIFTAYALVRFVLTTVTGVTG
jgi:hypothetical protein